MNTLSGFSIRARMSLIGLISLTGFIVLIAVATGVLRAQMTEDRVTMTRNLTEVGRLVLQRQYERATRGEVSEAEAKRAAVEELREFRYANEEYFFIDDYRGYSVLLPVHPGLEGTYVLDLVDTRGRKYVRAQRDAALANGGTVRYEFTKPGTGKPSEKLAYILPFSPWGWFIATGIYLDDVDREIRSVMRNGISFLVVIALISVVLIHILSRGITVPLRQLTAVIRRLTTRDYGGAVAWQDRQDEVGDIARAIAIFKKTDRDYERLQAEIRDREEKARLDREAALALERDTAVRVEQTARLISMGEMALSIAHDLNQPLTAVSNYCMGCVRRLEAGTEDPTALLDAMRRAAGQASHAAKIITRLRRFLQRSEPSLEVQGLAGIIEDMAAVITSGASRSSTDIDIRIPEDLPPVMADRTMIEQVVLNLLRNAIEAMASVPAGRSRLIVIAGVDETATMVRTSVIDNGPGVPEEERAHLFRLFHTTRAQGMGVGLNICRTILEYHGGSIRMRPNPCGGAVFEFTLPVAGTA